MPAPERPYLSLVVSGEATAPAAPDVRRFQFPVELIAVTSRDAVPPLVVRNAGIRRASGEFIAALEPDLLASGQVLDFLARGVFDRGRIYGLPAAQGPAAPWRPKDGSAAADLASFTLLHRDAWFTLRGYPEIDADPANVAALFCWSAQQAGVHVETVAAERPPAVPTSLPVLDGELLDSWERLMRPYGRPMIFNLDDWGIRDGVCAEPVALKTRF